MAIIDELNAIGNAIRKKKGTTAKMQLKDMPQAILSIEGGGSGGDSGVVYTNIVYNDDDTITLTDTDGIEHTIVCEYDGDKLIGVTFDGEAVELTYNDDELVGIGEAAVDMKDAPVTTSYPPTWFTFKVDVEPMGTVERID